MGIGNTELSCFGVAHGELLLKVMTPSSVICLSVTEVCDCAGELQVELVAFSTTTGATASHSLEFSLQALESKLLLTLPSSPLATESSAFRGCKLTSSLQDSEYFVHLTAVIRGQNLGGMTVPSEGFSTHAHTPVGATHDMPDGLTAHVLEAMTHGVTSGTGQPGISDSSDSSNRVVPFSEFGKMQQKLSTVWRYIINSVWGIRSSACLYLCSQLQKMLSCDCYSGADACVPVMRYLCVGDSSAAHDSGAALGVSSERGLRYNGFVDHIAVSNRAYLEGLIECPDSQVLDDLASEPKTSVAAAFLTELKDAHIVPEPVIAGSDFRLVSPYMVQFVVSSKHIAPHVALETGLAGRFSDNNFLLTPRQPRTVAFLSDHPVECTNTLSTNLSFLSLKDTRLKL